MQLKQDSNISERQVEDALVANLVFLSKIMRLPPDIKLIARQLRLKSGDERIDILLSSGKNLCLVELKVVEFSGELLKQLLSYRDELVHLQNVGELVAGNVSCFLLVTGAKGRDVEAAKQNNVEVIVYEPLEVLKDYYDNLSAVAPFLKIKPNDYGVFNLGLINRALVHLGKGENKQDEIATKTKLSKQSIHNHLKVAEEFGLVRKRDKRYLLTDIGDQYVRFCNTDVFTNQLNMKQIEILKQFVAEDPFQVPVEEM